MKQVTEVLITFLFIIILGALGLIVESINFDNVAGIIWRIS